jgi:hypothetical protein
MPVYTIRLNPSFGPPWEVLKNGIIVGGFDSKSEAEEYVKQPDKRRTK